MKKFITFLLRYSPGIAFLAIIASILAGMTNTALIALINQGIESEGQSSTRLIWSFVGICILLPITRIVGQVLLSYLSQIAIKDLRMHLSQKILSAPLREIEIHGPNKLLATLTNDVTAIGNALVSIPFFFMNVTIVFTGIGYLFWLYWPAATGIILAMIVGFGVYALLASASQKYLRQARKEQNVFFKHFRALTHGIKELQQHVQRRKAFMNDLLQGTGQSFLRNRLIGDTYYAAAGSMGQFFIFGMVGFLIFILPMLLPSSAQVLTGYALVLLYLTQPLQTMVQIVAPINMAIVSLQHVEALGLSLDKYQREDVEPKQANPDWTKISYQGLQHTYYRESEDENFKLGPITLDLVPGELLFIVGGNGSGKTTLAKILVGLYAPEEGEIYLDGNAVTAESQDEFRQYFSTVFSDFFLFETMLGIDTPKIDEVAEGYLEKLQLNHKVRVENGCLSTLELSQGQRKRLALLTAYLEDRPIYVFDEWAADQDPYFKDVFYLVLLKGLKENGKTVIVISHDDHYYHVADRIVKLDLGKIEEHPAPNLGTSNS